MAIATGTPDQKAILTNRFAVDALALRCASRLPTVNVSVRPTTYPTTVPARASMTNAEGSPVRTATTIPPTPR